MAENEELELPECEDEFEMEMDPQREHEVLSEERLHKWKEHIQPPENLLGWRSRYKKPDRDPITKIQCDPIQAHQKRKDILELELPTPYEDKDAFKPFEQNIKKQQNMSTNGCIYTAAIMLDKNSEDRQKELCEIMKEFIQQVREELHFVKADVAEARQEIANISAALLEGEEEEAEGEGLGEVSDQVGAGVEVNGAAAANQIPTLPDAPSGMSSEYLQFKKQAETQLAAMEPSMRMQTDQNYLTAVSQATDDASRQKLEEDYKTYFMQEYNYYKAYYDQELAKLSGAPVAAAPLTQAMMGVPQQIAAPVAPVTQGSLATETQEVTPVTPIKVKPAKDETQVEEENPEDGQEENSPEDEEPSAEPTE